MPDISNLIPSFLAPLSGGSIIFLLSCLGVALAFEFVNGFHDTANAVATVIYTNSLKPKHAVVWSGIWNFIGCYTGGVAVAYSIVHLLPIDLLMNIDSRSGMCMILSLLIAAISWNVGTWYLGIPASSSHTLIGSVLGVGVANSLLPGNVWGSGVNWSKATDIGVSLLLSPLIGGIMGAIVLLGLKKLVKRGELHQPPQGNKPPPWSMRWVLLGTCTGVSFAHGSNDGQKGVGLIMLILISLIPAQFALNPGSAEVDIRATERAAATIWTTAGRSVLVANNAASPHTDTAKDWRTYLDTSRAFAESADESQPRDGNASIRKNAQETLRVLEDRTSRVRTQLAGKTSIDEIDPETRIGLRSHILQIDEATKRFENNWPKWSKLGLVAPLAPEQQAELKQARLDLKTTTEYAPTWVLLAVASALGIGTTVGWRRIVTTVGEKIGKEHLTYSQGASAELVAMSTIGFADFLGLPVSTTQILSSGVAGTMAANNSGIRWATVRAIGIAWILTLPVSMLISGSLYLGLVRIFG